jgi:choline dehydrogenase
VVLAARLSERRKRRVLLIEAGRDYPPSGELPADLSNGGRGSVLKHDWGLTHQTRLDGFRFPFPRGRVMGGSSAVNTCIALRGQPEDYDEWAALGLHEWSWERCLPAFRRLESDQDFDGESHGTAGPLPIRRHPPNEWVPWQRAFVEACSAHGFAYCPDSNAPGKAGVGPHAMNKLGGRRISAAEAYLTPQVRARDNLTLLAESTAVRVLFQNRKVSGVEVKRRGAVERITTRCVVLSAGAIHTPAILLASGIGPDDAVRRIGAVPIVRAPAVGRRLLDHPGFAMFLFPKRSFETSRTHPLLQTVLRYASGKREHCADMLLQPGSTVPLPRITLPMVSLMGCIGKPRGHGLIRWEARDPSRPRIESCLLEDREDLELAADTMQLAARLLQEQPFLGKATSVWPDAATLRHRDDLKSYVVKLCDSAYHPCGTVPMGTKPSRNAAVDGRGRVFGVEGLYVADASVMPTIPSSNIHLPTLMIAERMAEWLRDASTT